MREGAIGESTSKGGRRSVKLEFVPSSRYAFGIDIGGTKTMLLLTDLNGSVIAKRRVQTNADKPNVLDRVGQEAKRFILESGVDVSRIVGTGIGVPGTVEYATGIVAHSPNLHLTDVNIKSFFRDKLPGPVFVDNDVNMAVIGERWKGNAAGYPNVFLVAVGTGLGAGILVNDQVVRGANGFAGEIGFTHVDPLIEGYKAHPDKFGPIEHFTTGLGISAQARELLPLYPKSILQGQEISSEMVFEAAQKQDELACLVVSRTIKYLSFGISNAVALLNPNVVLIGGGISDVGDTFIQAVHERVNNLLLISTKVVRATLGGEAGAFGAAATALLESNNMAFSTGDDAE